MTGSMPARLTGHRKALAIEGIPPRGFARPCGRLLQLQQPRVWVTTWGGLSAVAAV
jgi:hypothetical protein